MIMMATNVSENEETERGTNKTKVSDSGYSNSCSNSQSQRSTNSSKSRHSNSSGSSGYCGHPLSTLGSSGDENHKKKKSKAQITSDDVEQENNEDVTALDTSFTAPHPAVNKGSQQVKSKGVSPACVDPALLDNMSSPTMESEALQVGVLAQTLYCLHSDTSSQPQPLPITNDDQVMIKPPPPVKKELQNTEMIISDLKDEIKHEKEFSIVVSLSDGTVVCTTPSLTSVLGFPKDMWTGRSLINFMHPKDRIAFASHITSAMARSRFKERSTATDSSDKTEDPNYFYCWIRLYNGLNTSGFNVSEKKATYLPCQLSMSFKEVPDQGVFLVAAARQVKPAYKVSVENRYNPPTFTIRHTANTLISHVDNDVVSHFGYLPHHMIGRSIFDFYYTEDLPYLKDVYTNVIMEEGLLFLSRPYKFRCQNGDCVMVETEWSSFINPWGKKLEFIIGRHRVLTGPQNPDVINPNLEPEVLPNNEEEQSGSKAFQEEIKVLLTEPIVKCYEPNKQQLAQLVESLEKISSSQPQDQPSIMPAPVPSAASEMLGEISPHHVYSDSKSSSETPSYTQLTYNENIQRFFASEPKTVGSNESRDTKNEQNQSSSSGGEEGKSIPNNSSFTNSDSCLNGSSRISSISTSGRIKADSSSRPSVKQTVKLVTEGPGHQSQPQPQHNTSAHTSAQYITQSHPLTQELLYQHNENMNKQMAQKHKKKKSKGQGSWKHKNRHITSEEIEQDRDIGGHGMKRTMSHSWEGEPLKAFKSERVSPEIHCRLAPTSAPAIPTPVWPPVPPMTDPHHMNYSSTLVSSMLPFPCVYVPPPPPACSHQAHTQARPSEHPGPPTMQSPLMPPPYLTHQVQYMPGLMYQLPLVPMVYTHTHTHTQSHIVPASVKPTMTYMPSLPQTNSSKQQPSSGATSIKGEPGSAMCSFASTPLKQELSDCSKKEDKSRASSPVYEFSPGGFTCDTEKTKDGTFDNDLTQDDTSYCSYSSLFPKTEKSDDSLKDHQEKSSNGQYKVWRNSCESHSRTVLRTLRKEPSWLENIDVTPDLMLRYQMDNRVLSQVLQSDFDALLKLHQPDMVNEQLDELYTDLEGLSKQLTLEDSFPSSGSGSSSDEKHLSSAMPSTSASTSQAADKAKKKIKFMGHAKCAMIFEEDAPMPPPTNELVAIEIA